MLGASTGKFEVGKNEAIRQLLQLEARERLWEREVLGYPVWAMERLREYRRRQLGRSDFDPKAPGRAHVTRLLESVRDVSRAIRKARPGRDIWVLSSTAYRRKDERGDYQCIFAEHLRSQLGDRLLFLEINTALLPSLGRDDVIYVDAARIALWGLARLLSPAVSPAVSKEGQFDTLPLSRRQLVHDALYARTVQALARRLLEQERPRAVFVICGYDAFIPFQSATRQLEIPLIELQHGVIHESHPGYVFPPELRALHTPDHLVVFGSHYGELLEKASPYWKTRWTVGGHPWLSGKARGLTDGNRDRVVVFSQSDAPVRERLRQLLPPLRQAIPPDVGIIVKPHPREIDAKKFYAPALGPGVELASIRDDSYALLASCRLALSVFSTVAIEALAFPCTSVVLRSPYWSEDIQRLVEQGFLKPADTISDIVELLGASDGRADRSNVARRLFGIGQSPPDFLELIEHCREQRW